MHTKKSFFLTQSVGETETTTDQSVLFARAGDQGKTGCKGHATTKRSARNFATAFTLARRLFGQGLEKLSQLEQ